MKRLAFNGGQISRNLAMRSDLDIYARSCTLLENFDVLQSGGISRRRGMRYICDATHRDSALIAYSYDNKTSYLVELTNANLLIRDRNGVELASFASDNTWNYHEPRQVRSLQINSLLLLLDVSNAIMQLKCDSAGVWSFKRFEFKNPPWYSVELRERAINITPQESNSFTVQFDAEEEPSESQITAGETLRASYYTERQEAYALANDIIAGTISVDSISSASLFALGDKLAMRAGNYQEFYVCTVNFDASAAFVKGLDSPANYPDNFLRSERHCTDDGRPSIFGLDALSDYKKGDLIILNSGYYELYTCTRAFDGTGDYTGSNHPKSYQSHFISGVPVGEALTCKGGWKFYCSGSWIGAYEVRRCYDSAELSEQWSTLAESISEHRSTENRLLPGDESEEACYLRLMLTKINYKGSNNIADGMPLDVCNNSLVVSAYKHDIHLKALSATNFKDVSPIPVAINAPIRTKDWSWQAFAGKYGHPSCAAIHENRLVLAATQTQTQTFWISCSDDLNNFATGKRDNAAMHLTMSTTTQSRICWICSRAGMMQAGTEDGEWILKASNGNAITPENIIITAHGKVGSSPIPAIESVDKVVFCERGSGRVYQYGYSLESDAYTAQDLNAFCDDIAIQHGGIVQGAIIRKPTSVLMFTLADGYLALMTYNSMHNVNAWHLYSTQGQIKNIAVIPNGNHQDQLFMVVHRGASTSIECIDHQSTYNDCGGLDYTSTMITTAFSAPDYSDKKVINSKLEIYLTDATPAKFVQISTDAKTWHNPDRVGYLPSAWSELVAPSGWHKSPSVALRVSGETACCILCMQS